VINFNPQVLTDAFTVNTAEITIPMSFGDTVQILDNNPNRIAIIFSAHTGPSIINIRPPQSENDGIWLADGAGPLILDYRNHGAMVGYAWYALNGAPFSDGQISVITSSYRPDR
jgi:hypothetical protein